MILNMLHDSSKNTITVNQKRLCIYHWITSLKKINIETIWMDNAIIFVLLSRSTCHEQSEHRSLFVVFHCGGHFDPMNVMVIISYLLRHHHRKLLKKSTTGYLNQECFLAFVDIYFSKITSRNTQNQRKICSIGTSIVYIGLWNFVLHNWPKL